MERNEFELDAKVIKYFGMRERKSGERILKRRTVYVMLADTRTAYIELRGDMAMDEFVQNVPIGSEIRVSLSLEGSWAKGKAIYNNLIVNNLTLKEE